MSITERQSEEFFNRVGHLYDTENRYLPILVQSLATPKTKVIVVAAGDATRNKMAYDIQALAKQHSDILGVDTNRIYWDSYRRYLKCMETESIIRFNAVGSYSLRGMASANIILFYGVDDSTKWKEVQYDWDHNARNGTVQSYTQYKKA